MIVSIGHRNFIESDSVLEILSPDTARARHMRCWATEEGMLIDATSGRKARSVIQLKSTHVVLNALRPEALKLKFKKLSLN